MTCPQILNHILRIVLIFSIVCVPGPLIVSRAYADPDLGEISEKEERAQVLIDAESVQDAGQSATGEGAEHDERISGGDVGNSSEMDGSLKAAFQKTDNGEQHAALENTQADELVEQGQPLAVDHDLTNEFDACIRAFEEVRNEYARENEVLAKMQDERAVLTSSIEKFRDEVERAQSALDAANDELASFEGSGFRKFIMSILKPRDYESQLFLLHTLIKDRSGVIESSNAAKCGLEHKKEELDEQMAVQGEHRRMALEKVNSRACELEACCSKLHQSIKDISANMSGESQVATDGQLLSVGSSFNGVNIVEAESLLMQWYGETNALSGMRGGLSFGEGADFSMNQAFFVEKWGAAIDAYFEKCDGEPGVSPLKGLGKIMASSAYKYRIDPRLCAAVSVAESSGGRHCIKAHNAWGWGAVDSDPYGGALSWGTWEEAIEAWHKGMAESKTGLANARTISILANVYCSNPIWGVTVARVMNDISARTLPESLAS